MCPDRPFISVYYDNELPSPWKEKMETHLASCPECRTVLSSYKSLKTCFRDKAQESVETAGERVWKKLTAPELAFPQVPAAELYRQKAGNIFRRSITLPLPAAAAAAVFVLAIFITLLTTLRGPETPGKSPAQESVAAALPEIIQVLGDDHGTLQMQDMSGVLQYLSSQDYGDFMVIRLPDSRKFSRIGEPSLINAADYSRRSSY
jgi:hypothetical protein